MLNGNTKLSFVFIKWMSRQQHTGCLTWRKRLGCIGLNENLGDKWRVAVVDLFLEFELRPHNILGMEQSEHFRAPARAFTLVKKGFDHNQCKIHLYEYLSTVQKRLAALRVSKTELAHVSFNAAQKMGIWSTGAKRLFSQPCDSSWKRQSWEPETLQAWQAAGTSSPHRRHQEESPRNQTKDAAGLQRLFMKTTRWKSHNPSRRSYHSFEKDVVRVHDQVKPLIQPRQLVLVPRVRSAAMVLHHLTHAGKGTHELIKTLHSATPLIYTHLQGSIRFSQLVFNLNHEN